MLDMVGIDNTSTHTEIKIINDRLYLIELNSRPGGDNIAYRLTELSTGFSYLGGAIDIALNNFKFPNDEDLDKNTSGLVYVTSQTEYMKNFRYLQRRILNCVLQRFDRYGIIKLLCNLIPRYVRVQKCTCFKHIFLSFLFKTLVWRQIICRRAL